MAAMGSKSTAPAPASGAGVSNSSSANKTAESAPPPPAGSGGPPPKPAPTPLPNGTPIADAMKTGDSLSHKEDAGPRKQPSHDSQHRKIFYGDPNILVQDNPNHYSKLKFSSDDPMNPDPRINTFAPKLKQFKGFGNHTGTRINMIYNHSVEVPPPETYVTFDKKENVYRGEVVGPAGTPGRFFLEDCGNWYKANPEFDDPDGTIVEKKDISRTRQVISFDGFAYNKEFVDTEDKTTDGSKHEPRDRRYVEFVKKVNDADQWLNKLSYDNPAFQKGFGLDLDKKALEECKGLRPTFEESEKVKMTDFKNNMTEEAKTHTITQDEYDKEYAKAFFSSDFKKVLAKKNEELAKAKKSPVPMKEAKEMGKLFRWVDLLYKNKRQPLLRMREDKELKGKFYPNTESLYLSANRYIKKANIKDESARNRRQKPAATTRGRGGRGRGRGRGRGASRATTEAEKEEEEQPMTLAEAAKDQPVTHHNTYDEEAFTLKKDDGTPDPCILVAPPIFRLEPAPKTERGFREVRMSSYEIKKTIDRNSILIPTFSFTIQLMTTKGVSMGSSFELKSMLYVGQAPHERPPFGETARYTKGITTDAKRQAAAAAAYYADDENGGDYDYDENEATTENKRRVGLEPGLPSPSKKPKTDIGAGAGAGGSS